MTTEQHITDLAARLKAAYPKRHTAISMALDNHGSGRTRLTYWSYISGVHADGDRGLGPAKVSPDFHTFPELQAWVEKHWL